MEEVESAKTGAEQVQTKYEKLELKQKVVEATIQQSEILELWWSVNNRRSNLEAYCALENLRRASHLFHHFLLESP